MTRSISRSTTGRASSWARCILGKVLNGQGFATEEIPADSQVVYTSMCEGDIHVVHEVWQGAFGVAFEEVVAQGCVIDAATHDAKTREEWWYPSLCRGAVPGPARLAGAECLRRDVLDSRDGPEGSLPRRSGRLVEARRRACRGPRHGLRGRERRLGRSDLGGARIGVRAQGADRPLQLDAQLHRGDLRRQVRRVPRVWRGLQGRPGLGSQPRHDLRLRQPEGRLSQDRRLEGHARQVADGLCHRLEDEPDQSRHRGDVQARRHRRDGSGGGGRQVARRQRSQVACPG